MRKERGFSVSRFAELIGVHRVNVSYYESGRTKPSRAVKLHMARVFEMPVEELDHLFAEGAA